MARYRGSDLKDHMHHCMNANLCPSLRRHDTIFDKIRHNNPSARIEWFLGETTQYVLDVIGSEETGR